MLELSLHILDVLENAVEAGAKRIELNIIEDRVQDTMRIEAKDNGRGMSRELCERVLDPFVTTRTTRRVGLGLPLLAAAARRCEGDLSVESEPGRGARVEATFRRSHLDRAPLGDMASTLLAVLLADPPVDVAYTHQVDGRRFEFDSAQVRAELGEVPLSQAPVRKWIERTVREGEESLRQTRPMERTEKREAEF